MKPVVVTVAAAVVALGAYYVFSTQGEDPAPEQASDAVSVPATDPQPVTQPEPLETPVEQVETAVEDAVETTTEAAQDAVDTATEAAEDAVENAQDAVKEAADAVKDVVEQAGAEAAEQAGAVAEAAEDSVGSATETASEAAESATEAVEGAMEAATDAAAEAAPGSNSSDIATLLTPEGFDYDAVIEAIEASDLTQFQKTALTTTVEKAKDSPELLSAALDQVKAALGL
ncbi:hypothetical protein [Phycobacter azelaicus]|uniref:hypothetical protein n=1 Tax=Phycobacter azelaicus TaxID=2668075 RepID=UPI001868161E|nr:hypothetical protein [Phycobacter azelaicus]